MPKKKTPSESTADQQATDTTAPATTQGAAIIADETPIRRAPPDKAEIAALLDETATLLELDGGNPFEVRAYQNAARAVGALEGDIEALARSGQLATVPGLGKTILTRITELLATGQMRFHDQLAEKIPVGLRQMTRIPGLGAKRVRQLNSALGVSTLEELKQAAQDGRIATISGFGEKSQEKILQGIAFLQQHQDRFRIDIAEAQAEAVAAELRALPQVVRMEIAGSIRRRRETVHDIDIVGSVAQESDRAPIMQRLLSLPEVVSVIGTGDTKTSVILRSGIALDLRLVLDDEYPYLLHHLTGAKAHNVSLRTHAQRIDMKISEYGVWKGEQQIACKDETDLYRAFGMAYIPPELREDRGEFEAARNNALPTLVTEADLKGILHVHSTWSDGQSTIHEMAEAARAMGAQYLGISDHSRSAAYAGGLSADAVRRQHDEIDKLNADYAGAFRVLKGTECDILRDGALDYDDETLSKFDFVVASIHSLFNLPPEEQTQRLMHAMENPYCSIVGHPTGRILLEREGYAPDLEAVIERAGKLGVAIEINADPHRLDLDWRLLHFAKDHGVRIPICPDAHSPAGLRNIRYGVGIARKGWLTAEDVLNTRDAADILAFFAAQRAQRA
jgi:DNA polymerase (family X)